MAEDVQNQLEAILVSTSKPPSTKNVHETLKSLNEILDGLIEQEELDTVVDMVPLFAQVLMEICLPQCRQQKALFFALDDFLMSLTSSCPTARSCLLTSPLTRSLLALLSDLSFPLRLRHVACKTVNNLLSSSSRDLRNQILTEYQHILDVIARQLGLLGDFDVQTAHIELVFRLGSSAEHLDKLARRWFGHHSNRLADLFCAITKADFEPDSRTFLNALNLSKGRDATVKTFSCLEITVGNRPVDKPPADKYERLWVDFNLGSRSILVFCTSSIIGEEGKWDALTIESQDVVGYEIKETGRGNLQTVFIDLTRDAYLLFDSTSMSQFPGREVKMTFDKDIPLQQCVDKVFECAKENMMKKTSHMSKRPKGLNLSCNTSQNFSQKQSNSVQNELTNKKRASRPLSHINVNTINTMNSNSQKVPEEVGSNECCSTRNDVSQTNQPKKATVEAGLRRHFSQNQPNYVQKELKNKKPASRPLSQHIAVNTVNSTGIVQKQDNAMNSNSQAESNEFCSKNDISQTNQPEKAREARLKRHIRLSERQMINNGRTFSKSQELSNDILMTPPPPITELNNNQSQHLGQMVNNTKSEKRIATVPSVEKETATKVCTNNQPIETNEIVTTVVQEMNQDQHEVSEIVNDTNQLVVEPPTHSSTTLKGIVQNPNKSVGNKKRSVSFYLGNDLRKRAKVDSKITSACGDSVLASSGQKQRGRPRTTVRGRGRRGPVKTISAQPCWTSRKNIAYKPQNFLSQREVTEKKTFKFFTSKNTTNDSCPVSQEIYSVELEHSVSNSRPKWNRKFDNTTADSSVNQSRKSVVVTGGNAIRKRHRRKSKKVRKLSTASSSSSEEELRNATNHDMIQSIQCEEVFPEKEMTPEDHHIEDLPIVGTPRTSKFKTPPIRRKFAPKAKDGSEKNCLIVNELKNSQLLKNNIADMLEEECVSMIGRITIGLNTILADQT